MPRTSPNTWSIWSRARTCATLASTQWNVRCWRARRTRRARQHLEQIFGSTRIEEMRGYFACTTTNLTRARAEIHDRGLLAHWLVASMSVPGVAPPVIYNGDVLVDGGVLSPVPSGLLADLGRGPVLASDVSADERFGAGSGEGGLRAGEDVNIFRVLYRTATLSTEEELEARGRY